MEVVMSSEEPYHLSIYNAWGKVRTQPPALYMIEWYATSLRYHLSHAVR